MVNKNHWIIILGIIFSFFQLIETIESGFSIDFMPYGYGSVNLSETLLFL